MLVSRWVDTACSPMYLLILLLTAHQVHERVDFVQGPITLAHSTWWQSGSSMYVRTYMSVLSASLSCTSYFDLAARSLFRRSTHHTVEYHWLCSSSLLAYTSMSASECYGIAFSAKPLQFLLHHLMLHWGVASFLHHRPHHGPKIAFCVPSGCSFKGLLCLNFSPLCSLTLPMRNSLLLPVHGLGA